MAILYQKVVDLYSKKEKKKKDKKDKKKGKDKDKDKETVVQVDEDKEMVKLRKELHDLENAIQTGVNMTQEVNNQMASATEESMLSTFEGKIEKRPQQQYQIVYETARRDSIGSYNSYHSIDGEDKDSEEERKVSSKDILDEVEYYQKNKEPKQSSECHDLDSSDSDQDLGQKLKEYNFALDEEDMEIPPDEKGSKKKSKTKSEKEYQREYDNEMSKDQSKGRRGREIGDEFSVAMQTNRTDRLIHNVKSSKPKMASCL